MIVLTKTQKAVLKYILQGLTNKEIASELHLSQDTVRNHVVAILKRSKEPSRCKLIADYYLDKIAFKDFLW